MADEMTYEEKKASEEVLENSQKTLDIWGDHYRKKHQAIRKAYGCSIGEAAILDAINRMINMMVECTNHIVYQMEHGSEDDGDLQ